MLRASAAAAGPVASPAQCRRSRLNIPHRGPDRPYPPPPPPRMDSYEESFIVRCYEVGVNKTATVETIANLLQGGSGYAKHIRFQNFYMKNVQNPIIIDQNYCDSKEPCHQQKSVVHVSDVVYKNIKGTSASDVAIDFECSKSVPCQGIVLQDINLVKENGGSAKTICKNVKLTEKRNFHPPACA